MNGIELMKLMYGEPPPKRQPDLFTKNPKQNTNTMKAEISYSVYQKEPYQLLVSGSAQKVKNFINSQPEADKKSLEIYRLTNDRDVKLSVIDFLVEATGLGV